VHRIAILFVLAFAVALVPALADVQVVGSQLSDWGQGFTDPENSNYDTIIVQLIGGAGGPLVSPDGALTPLSGGWAETYDNGIIAEASGPATTDEGWTFNFVPSSPADVSMYFWALSGGNQIDTGILGYASPPAGSSGSPGSGWWWIQLDSVPIPNVPEPGAASLFVTMLAGVFGLAGVLRKKLG